MRGPRRRSAVVIDSRNQGERDRRTQRRVERKVAKVEAQTHGGYAGPSIREILEDHLLKACVRYLAIKEEHEGPCCEQGPVKIGQARGIVRGLAEGLAILRNPYIARESVKGVEQEFMRRARRSNTE